MIIKNTGCPFGMVTRQMVKGIKEEVVDMKDCVNKLTNHYSKRLPHWATIMITILSSLCVGLIVKGVYAG